MRGDRGKWSCGGPPSPAGPPRGQGTTASTERERTTSGRCGGKDDGRRAADGNPQTYARGLVVGLLRLGVQVRLPLRGEDQHTPPIETNGRRRRPPPACCNRMDQGKPAGRLAFPALARRGETPLPAALIAEIRGQSRSTPRPAAA